MLGMAIGETEASSLDARMPGDKSGIFVALLSLINPQYHQSYLVIIHQEI
jgi:hypothetical protein